MRQSSRVFPVRAPGDPFRNDSIYPLFDIFRADYIKNVTGYSKLYIRGFAAGRERIPDKLVEGMTMSTGWSVERLFGPEFLKEWQTDHKDAE